ncbi:MAG: SIS domain-containing protein [Erysipelotrichaceae bacterium]|nr:SIS domain-containing protein [Erysipelotrichaceae bacterium]
MDFRNGIHDYYEREKQVFDALDPNEFNAALNALLRHYDNEDTIYVIGNGGSSATANHMVCDFNKGISLSLSKPFHVVSLTDNIPSVMAYGNDVGFEDVFYLPLKQWLKPSDMVIAISGSGNSHNVIKAVTYAKKIGAEILGLEGYDGGKLKAIADINIHAKVNDMQIAEDVHMTFVHVAMQLLWKALMAREGKEAIYSINH